MSTAVAYRSIAANLDRSLKTIESKPDVRREVAYFRAQIGSIKSVDDLMRNKRVYSFVMNAFGLGDMAYAKAFMRKVLEQGIDEPSSLANRLPDPRYRELVTALNFARYGSAATAFERAQASVVERSLRQSLEAATGQESEGARMALYFARRAPSLKSVYGLLADKTLLQVTLTALQLPDTFSLQSIERQADQLSRRLELSDFADQKSLGRFLDKFTVLWDVRHPPPQSANPILTTTQTALIQVDLLSRVQQLKLGGR